MAIIRILLMGAIIVIGAVFASLNDQMVVLDYYVSSIEWPMALIAGLFFLIGWFFGIASMFPSWFRASRRAHHYRRDLSKEKRKIRGVAVTEQKSLASIADGH